MRTTLLSLLLLSLFSFTATNKAHAFKVKTHVLIANRVLGAIDQNGEIPIQSLGRVKLDNAEVLYAVRNYPAYFRAGALGPDSFPDIIAGQLWAHSDGAPGTNDQIPFERRPPAGWRSIDHGMYLLKAAMSWTPPPLSAEDGREARYGAIAFAYGYLCHMVSDSFAHGYVNEWAGASWDIFTGDGMAGNFTEELKHLGAEGYLDVLLEDEDDLSQFVIRAPHHFLHEIYAAQVDYKDEYPAKLSDGSVVDPTHRSKRGAVAGPIFEELIELQEFFERASDAHRWSENTGVQATTDAYKALQKVRKILDPMPAPDPVADLENMFRWRAEILDELRYKWTYLSECTAQNILLGTVLNGKLTADACAGLDLETNPVVAEFFGGELNDRLHQNESDYGPFTLNAARFGAIVQIVLSRIILIDPMTEVGVVSDTKDILLGCFEALGGDTTFCEEVCHCGGGTFAKWACRAAKAPLGCVFCWDTPICEFTDQIDPVEQAMKELKDSMIEALKEYAIDAAIEYYTGTERKKFEALWDAFEGESGRYKGAWMVNFSYFPEDLRADPGFVMDMLKAATGLALNLPANSVPTAQAAAELAFFAVGAVKTANRLYQYVDVTDVGGAYEAWKGILELLIGVARGEVNLYEELEGAGRHILTDLKFKSGKRTYENRYAAFARLMQDVFRLASLRGPTARHMEREFGASGGRVELTAFHATHNAIEMMKLALLGHSALVKIFPNYRSSMISQICLDQPNIMCDGIASLDDPNHHGEASRAHSDNYPMKWNSENFDVFTPDRIDWKRSTSFFRPRDVRWDEGHIHRGSACNFEYSGFAGLRDRESVRTFVNIFRFPSDCQPFDKLLPAYTAAVL